MPATLGQRQRLFMRYLPRLIDYIHECGYECTGGDLFRDPRVHGKAGEKVGYGHPKSNHKNKLAIDINLFLDGKYLTKTSDHAKFGAYWKSLHPLFRWGGDFVDENGNGKDGNHYSLEYNGMW